MSEYTKWLGKVRHIWKEIRPIKFAWSDWQIEDMMIDWGLNPKTDIDKLCSPIHGEYTLNDIDDEPHRKLKELMKEKEDFIKNDKRGNGFIYEMFRYALAETKYDYTNNPDDAVNSLGYTKEQIRNSRALKYGLTKAANTLCRYSKEIIDTYLESEE